MHLDEGFDIATLMMWIVIGIVSMVFCYGVVMTNCVPYTLPDKTSLTAMSDNTPTKYQWYVRDILLMMMVADEYCPDPKAIDVQVGETEQDTLIKFDSDYLQNMEGYLQQYYIRYLHNIVDQPISAYEYYYEGIGENGRWRYYVE